jgi:hypothetical protein
MGAAIDPILGLDAVPDDSASAMCASRCHTLDRALEAVEGHASIALNNQDGLVVLVPADIALGHSKPFYRGIMMSWPAYAPLPQSGTDLVIWSASLRDPAIEQETFQ